MRIEGPSSNQANGKWQRRAIIFLCALTVALPLAIRGSSCGHDFDFHIQSWLAVAQQWHQGTLYPHWIDAANYMAGEPRFIFYPPLSWMLGAILGILLPWSAVPIAFTLIVLTACGFSMNKLAREWLPPNAATVAACAYILNPYALFVAYERTAYAELAAGIWLPLIILYALRCADGTRHVFLTTVAREKIAQMSKPELKELRLSSAATKSGNPGLRNKSLVSLALTIAAIWLTNAPAAVMACYTLAVITIWKAIAEKHWQPILNSAISLILGLGLAAFYIVPAAYERRWVDIARAIDPGMRIVDSFLFGHTGESFHDQVLHSASWIFVTMLATIAFSTWIIWKRDIVRRIVLPLSVTAAVLFALQLPASNFVWRIAPELRFLQFPWRWTLVLSIAFALSLGAALAKRKTNPREPQFRVHAIAILLAAITAVSLGTRLFWQPCDDEDAVSAQLAVFQAGTGFEGTDEYTPLGADNSLVQQGLPKLRLLDAPDAEVATIGNDQQENPAYVPSDKDHLPLQAKIEQWLPNQRVLTITATSAGFAVLRLMDFPTWQVLANGTPIVNRLHREDGLMTIPIQAGLTRIDVKYVATPDLWWGRGISMVSLLTLLALAIFGQKRRRSFKID
jgi:hypothetical protein